MVTNYKGTRTGDHGGGGGTGRKLECWYCGGGHLKSNCPKRAEEKERKKDNGRANNKCAARETEVKEGQVHTMFTNGGTHIRDRLQ